MTGLPTTAAVPAPTDMDRTIVQRAHNWRRTEKEVIGSTGPEKERARSKHHRAKQDLAEAVDLAERQKGGAA